MGTVTIAFVLAFLWAFLFVSPIAEASTGNCTAFSAISQNSGALPLIVDAYDKHFVQEMANHPDGAEILAAMNRNQDPFTIPDKYERASESLDSFLEELQRVITESKLDHGKLKTLLLKKLSDHRSGAEKIEQKLLTVPDSPQSQLANWGIGDFYSFHDGDWLFAMKRMNPGEKKTIISYRSFAGKLKAPTDRKIAFSEFIDKAFYDPNTKNLYFMGWGGLSMLSIFDSKGKPSKSKLVNLEYVLPDTPNSKLHPSDIAISPNGKQILWQWGPNKLYVGDLNLSSPIKFREVLGINAGSFKPIGWVNDDYIYGIEYQRKAHILGVNTPKETFVLDSFPLLDLKQFSVGLDRGSLFFVFYNPDTRPHAIRFFFNSKKGSIELVKVHELDTFFLDHDEVDKVPHDSIFLLPNNELLNVHFPLDGKKDPALRFINAKTEEVRLSVPIAELRQLVRESFHRSVNGNERVRLSSDGKILLYDIKNTKGEIESRAWNLEDFMN